jgi:hypothetical protein
MRAETARNNAASVGFPCEDRTRLLIAYSDAVHAQASVMRGSGHNVGGLRLHDAIESAKRAFNEHVKKHHCSPALL